jgi:hypothetical protein
MVGTLAVALFMGGATAHAQGISNYNDIITGARATSLGGAFTAVADDSTAAIHNPAGLADAPRRGLSLSVSAYGFQRQTQEDVIAAETTSVDLELDSTLFYPGVTAYVIPLSDEEDRVQQAVAFSILAPRFFDIEGIENLSLSDDGIELDVFQSRTQRMLMAGPSYAMRVGAFSIGASAFVQYASFNEKLSSSVAVYFADGAGGEAASRHLDFKFTSGTYFGLTGNLGMLLSLPTTRLGVNVQMPSLRLGGSTKTYIAEAASFISLNPDGSFADGALYQDVLRDIEGNTRIRTPWVFSGGAAQRIGAHMISADVDVYLPVASHAFVTGQGAVELPRSPAELPGLESDRGYDGRVEEPRRRLVVNAALGAHVEILEGYDLMLGAFTDFSNVPDSAREGNPQIDLFGGSVGVCRRGEDSDLTIGITGRYGRGSVSGFQIEGNDINSVITDARQWSLALVIGGSKSLSDDEQPEEADNEPEEADDPRGSD